MSTAEGAARQDPSQRDIAGEAAALALAFESSSRAKGATPQGSSSTSKGKAAEVPPRAEGSTTQRDYAAEAAALAAKIAS